MFSLIITIISIALVAALAVASLYFGGSAFSQGASKAQAATLVAQAQQIAGANTLYAAENGGVYAADVSALQSGNYLSAVPAPPAKAAVGTWQIGANNVVYVDLVDDATAVATAVLDEVGGPAVDADFSATPNLSAGKQYGIANDTASADDLGVVFYFKG